MKKNIQNNLLLILSCMLLLTACSRKELVDLYPDFNADALNNPKNMDEVEQVLIGGYAAFRNDFYYSDIEGGNWSTMPDMMSDNLIEAKGALSNFNRMTDWLYNVDDNAIAKMWAAPYTVISRANIVLSSVDKFTTDRNKKIANRIKGQALAIRAHAHLDLMRYFGVSFKRSNNDLAIPYVKVFPLNDLAASKPARPRNDAFYKDLFDDLTTAEELLSDVDKDINEEGSVNRGFIDLAGVYAVQARAYLYAEQWEDAITAASNAIALRPLLTLNKFKDFAGMYNSTAAGETIWNIQFDAGQGGPGGAVYFVQNNRNVYRPADDIAVMDGTSGLIQKNDIRFLSYFKVVPNTSGEDRLVVYKYKGKKDLVDGNANFPVYRTGEMYLIRAEARARNNEEPLGMADLNYLRANRIGGYVPVSLAGPALLNAIQNERRRELFAEGHRFFDLKRTGKVMNRNNGCGDPDISPSGRCTLTPLSREWSLPIPFMERKVNAAIDQNNGYE